MTKPPAQPVETVTAREVIGRIVVYGGLLALSAWGIPALIQQHYDAASLSEKERHQAAMDWLHRKMQRECPPSDGDNVKVRYCCEYWSNFEQFPVFHAGSTFHLGGRTVEIADSLGLAPKMTTATVRFRDGTSETWSFQLRQDGTPYSPTRPDGSEVEILKLASACP